MKEVKEAKKKREQLLQKIDFQKAFYENILRYEAGGDTLEGEKTTIVLRRDNLYQEIWESSLSKTAKKYGIPYEKLRDACVKANIPLPTQSYWGNLHAGKPVQKTPLPDAADNELSIEYSYRKSTNNIRTLLDTAVSSTEPVQEEKASTISKEERKEDTVINPNGQNTYDRIKLYQEVWEQPVSKVALKYGVSDVMIHKVCKVLNVPVPPRGYWAKVQAGQNVNKEPLPPDSDKVALSGRRTDSKSSEVKSSQIVQSDTLGFLSEDERGRVVDIALNLKVDPNLKKLHPTLQMHKAAFSAWSKQHPRDKYANWNRDPYRSKSKDEPPLWECVSEETLPRVYRLLDPLFRSIEKLGGKIQDDLSMQIRNEHVKLKITEGRDQTPHVLTKSELQQVEKYEQDKRKYSYVYEPRFRKYDYIANGKLRISAYGDSFVRDTNTVVVEERIGEILLALYLQSEDVRIEREKREEAQRKAEEEKRQKELRRQKYNEEVEKLQVLTNEARDYEIACQIRGYIVAVESKATLDDKTKAWISWAKAKADWFDPTVSVSDPVFGKRNHGEDEKEKTPTKRNPYYW